MIVEYPNEILSSPTVDIVDFDDDLKSLVNLMAEEMYSSGGIGLAAPQIGKKLSIAIVDISEGEDATAMKVLINPKMGTIHSGKRILSKEGCLSIPGRLFDVYRYEKITVKFQNVTGASEEVIFEGFEACAVQHECDHLKGITIIDRANPKKVLKYLRDAKALARFVAENQDESQQKSS